MASKSVTLCNVLIKEPTAFDTQFLFIYLETSSIQFNTSKKCITLALVNYQQSISFVLFLAKQKKKRRIMQQK